MKSSVNPYRYAEEVFGDHFTGRQEELKTLISRLESGINVSLIAPRRTGKTSLIAEATRRLEARKPKAAIARINAMLCVSLADLAGALAEAAYQSAGRGYSSRGIADFIKRLRVSPTVTLDAKGNPTFSFEPRLCASDARRSFESVFEIMSEVANRRVATIVLDEFQHVLSLGEEVSGFFKALADRYPKVGLVLAGSDRHMMESLIAEKTAPLYGMTEPIYLGPIPSPDMVRFVVTRAAQSSKSMDEESANYIVSLAGPLPNDIQRLAFEAWTLAEGPIDKLVVILDLHLTVMSSRMSLKVAILAVPVTLLMCTVPFTSSSLRLALQKL